MTRVNWLGTVYTVRAALPRLVAQRSGHVVIVSSGAALRAFPQAAAYGATKAAQRAFAGALRHELAGTGVGVTTVFPGEIATRLHAHEEATMPAWYDGRRADPGELARLVLDAVEADRRDVVYPRQIRLLGLDGIAPRAVDRLLARLRGSSAAPRARLGRRRRVGVEALLQRLHAALGDLHERPRGGREVRVAARDEGERLVQRRVEGDRVQAARVAARDQDRHRADGVAEPARGELERRGQVLDLDRRLDPHAGLLRALAQLAAHRVVGAPARVVEDQRRLGERLDRDRLARRGSGSAEM